MKNSKKKDEVSLYRQAVALVAHVRGYENVRWFDEGYFAGELQHNLVLLRGAVHQELVNPTKDRLVAKGEDYMDVFRYTAQTPVKSGYGEHVRGSGDTAAEALAEVCAKLRNLIEGCVANRASNLANIEVTTR